MSASRKVLVVDDDPAVRKSIDRVLTNKGYAVITAQNGEEALRLAESRQGTNPSADPELGRIVVCESCHAMLVVPLHRGNNAYGMILSSDANKITANTIGCNLNAGVLISGANAFNNSVRNNWIGVVDDGIQEACESGVLAGYQPDVLTMHPSTQVAQAGAYWGITQPTLAVSVSGSTQWGSLGQWW